MATSYLGLLPASIVEGSKELVSWMNGWADIIFIVDRECSEAMYISWIYIYLFGICLCAVYFGDVLVPGLETAIIFVVLPMVM